MSTVAITAAGLAVAAATLLSPAPLAAQQPARTQWTASAGRATFAFRDVSRNIRPVDQSPIAWEGSGPALRARLDRLSRVSTHRVDVTWTQSSAFVYASPVRRVAASAHDEWTSLSTRYEYRRYFFRDLGVRGFDLGASAEAGFARATRQREYAAFVLSERSTGPLFGGAVAARFTRWARLALEGSWTNGLRLAHRSEVFGGDGPPPRRGWGGGWYDEWLATAALRAVGDLRLFAEYALSSQVAYAEHESSTERTGTLLLGVTYAR